MNRDPPKILTIDERQRAALETQEKEVSTMDVKLSDISC